MLGSRPIGGAPIGGSLTSAGPIEGTLSIVEADDTLVASVTLDLTGNLAATEVDDVATVVGALQVTGSVFATEDDDGFSATATLAIAGMVAATEGDDVPSASGTVDVVGTLVATESDDTLAASGLLGIEASLSVTEEDDTLTADALMPIWYPRRGGTEDQDHYEQRQIEWEQQLRRIIDRSWQIAHGEIDPVTLLPIPPPDYRAVIDELMRQAVALDQARVEAFIAEQEQMQEEEAISLLLLAA